ncbi:MAG TPA: hypothetical protein VJ464_22150 [Blastocatellia bacterium]|nr:hypothetical protein [Blastocatellia bacterium]
MTKRLRTLYITMLAISFAASLALHGGATGATPSKERPYRCTKAALAALKPAPKLDYECADDEDDNLKSPERQAAMKDYLRELEETFNDDGWWATSVNDLNACSIAKEVRPLTGSENNEFAFSIYLYGDHTTRLLAVIDPCIKYSYGTLDVYVLERAAGRVVATQVLDAFYTRYDASLFLEVAQLNGERLILVERFAHDGFATSLQVTAAAYTINPRTHGAVPKKIFKEAGKLTNEVEWDAPPFYELGRPLPDKGWRSPELVRKGRLVPRFSIDYPTRRGLRHQAYVWNGKYYSVAR